ncbi:MAG: lipoprotein [Pseudomonadales bacterium]|nr:lipoprotein [Pseudomonadales bacterium]
MRVIVATMLLFALAACGQKGPLYLPDSDQDKDQKEEVVK